MSKSEHDTEPIEETGTEPIEETGTEPVEETVERSPSSADVALRVGGAWLAIGAVLFVVGLVLHPPLPPDVAGFMATVAAEPGRWMAAHWASAIALSAFAIAGLIVLTAGSRLTRGWSTTSAWTALIVGALWVTTAAVSEATVITTAATTGDVATFEAWQRFAQAHAAAFVVLAGAVAVIAATEAQTVRVTVPAWASWIGAIAGIVAAVGFVLVVGAGIAAGGLVWVVAATVMSLWLLWFGVSLARSDAVAGARLAESNPGQHEPVR